MPPLRKRPAAEALGSALLLAAVVGSGIMADRLSGGNAGLALLANAIATGATLTAVILMLGAISGAHLNPAVTAVAVGDGGLPWREGAGYAPPSSSERWPASPSRTSCSAGRCCRCRDTPAPASACSSASAWPRSGW